jgi:hypothetical protein
VSWCRCRPRLRFWRSSSRENLEYSANATLRSGRYDRSARRRSGSNRQCARGS